jgi:hypothetical protein
VADIREGDSERVIRAIDCCRLQKLHRFRLWAGFHRAVTAGSLANVRSAATCVHHSIASTTARSCRLGSMTPPELDALGAVVGHTLLSEIPVGVGGFGMATLLRSLKYTARVTEESFHSRLTISRDVFGVEFVAYALGLSSEEAQSGIIANTEKLAALANLAAAAQEVAKDRPSRQREIARASVLAPKESMGPYLMRGPPGKGGN